MDKLKMHSPNLTQGNIARIRELFPNCVTEAKDKEGVVQFAVDFDQLKQELSESIVEGNQERYHLNWPGKREALLTANAPIAKTLRPCREESVDFDTTKNLFIEGDNLDALKLLQDTYLGKVKMIYIDPPYNTGNDFVYEDDFAENTEDYLQRSNQKDQAGNRLHANTEANGRFHSDWLSMMYTRLRLARNLLRDDGVIFISIDDGEVHNLRKICEEVFGDSNVEEMIWNKEAEGSSGTLKQILRFRVVHETIVVCYKFKDIHNFSRVSEPLVGKENELQTANLAVNEDSVKDGHPNWLELVSPTGKKWFKHWKFNNEEIRRLIEEDLLYWGKDGNNQPRLIIPTDHRRKVYAKSIINKGGTTQGRKDFESLMPEGCFPYPKPISLIGLLIQISNSNDIILDFFSGSATTAHAVMQLNAEDGGKRQFIMVQLPEACDSKSEAFKAGYKNIAEIGKERIRRAGQKIKTDHVDKENINALDIGFRTLKIDTSNMADVFYAPDALDKESLDMFVNNIKPDRTAEDLLFQVLLDWGVDLTLPITKQSIQGKQVFFVDGNALAACFDDSGSINEDFVKELATHQPLRVVFRDAGFKDSAVKINVEQIFKLLSPATEVKCI